MPYGHWIIKHENQTLTYRGRGPHFVLYPAPLSRDGWLLKAAYDNHPEAISFVDRAVQDHLRQSALSDIVDADAFRDRYAIVEGEPQGAV